MLLMLMAVLLAGLALHPFVTYPWSLRLLRAAPRPVPAPAAATPPASISVCLCAYNEAAVIQAKAENLLALRARSGGQVELLVYVDGQGDATAELLRPYLGQITVVVGNERQGKSHGMRQLAGMARGELLVFTDANVMIDPAALVALRRHFADPAVGCVCGHLIYGNAAASETSAVNAAYWGLEETIKQLESAHGTVIGADGSLFAVRRSLHPPVPPDIIDDFFVSLSILCDGHRVIRAGDVRAFEDSVVDSGEEFQRKVRIACQSFNVHRLLWPRLRRLPALPLYCYLSHKLLRWFAAPNLLLAGICLLLALLQWLPAGLVLGGAAAVLLLGAALVRLGWRPAQRGWEVGLAFLATALGILRSLRGERFQTWAPAQSIRGGAALRGGVADATRSRP